MDMSEVARGRIVVGVDGSTSSARAVEWGAEQARLEGRELLLFNGANPRPHSWVDESAFDLPAFQDAVRLGGEDLVESARSVVRDYDPTIVVRTQVILSDPRQALLELSADATMLVLGSHGRGPLRSLLLGSVSATVSQQARCPVVILRPQDPETEKNAVVVGVDVRQRSNNAAEFACRQASLRSLPLVVVHGYWNPDAVLGRSEVDFGDVDEERLAVAEVIGGQKEKFPDVAVTYKAVHGLAEDCLLRAAEGRAMVVVGARPMKGALALIQGQVSRAVTEHARCAVAVVPEAGPVGEGGGA